MPLVAVRFHRKRRKFAKYAIVKQEMTKVHKAVIKPVFIKQFDAIVANWRNRPGFGSRMLFDQDSIRLYVFPTGSEKAKQIWWWNVLGTKPHSIEAKNAPTLVFNWGGPGSYMSKTGPGGSWYGGPGRVSGGTIRRPRMVNHPGTKPRKWPDIIHDKNRSFYSRTVENAWRRALRKINSG